MISCSLFIAIVSRFRKTKNKLTQPWTKSHVHPECVRSAPRVRPESAGERPECAHAGRSAPGARQHVPGGKVKIDYMFNPGSLISLNNDACSIFTLPPGARWRTPGALRPARAHSARAPADSGHTLGALRAHSGPHGRTPRALWQTLGTLWVGTGTPRSVVSMWV